MGRRKRNWFRRILPVLLSAGRLVLVLALFGGGYLGVKYVMQRSNQEVAQIQQREEPDYLFLVEESTRMVAVNQDGEKSMEINAKEIKLARDQKTATFQDADATYFEHGNVSLTIKAGKIEYNTQTEDFFLTDGLEIETSDGMKVETTEVEWRRVKDPATARGKASKVPCFRFRKGVDVMSRDGNTIHADYMQADRELMYMEFVGHVGGDLEALSDTEFIQERDLTQVDELKLEDFKKLSFGAEKVIYDKRNQVVLATSRFYDREFTILDMDGQAIEIGNYQQQPQQVAFNKEEIKVNCNHLEAHIDRKWAICTGDINIVVPPATPKPEDDKALRAMKQYETRIGTGEVEYFWGRDYILTHSPTRVEQEDRLALCNQMTYWGDNKMVLLDGDITMVQGSGRWMLDEGIMEVPGHDAERAISSYTEVYADRCVVYLNNNDFIASGDAKLRQDEREAAADTIVYQDTIKRITAQGNVKFRDKDGQSILCSALIYHDETDYLEVSGGASADILLPAKFANDINRALAENREEEAPPEITDPEVSGTPPSHNPNANSKLANRTKLAPAGTGRPVIPAPSDAAPAAPAGSGLPALPMPGSDQGTPTPDAAGGAQELTIPLSGPPAPSGPNVAEAGGKPAPPSEPEPAPTPEPPQEDE